MIPSEAKRVVSVETYKMFQQAEGIPVHRGFFIEDLKTVELGAWARKGGRGAFVNLEGAGGTNDAYLCEIAPARALEPQRHLFEEMIYVIDGKGSTSVWYEEKRKLSFEWEEGSLFAIPMNAWHQHFNGQGSRSARYLAVTNAPVIMNLFHNVRFVFENSFVFDDRYSGEDSYFSGPGRLHKVKTGRAFLLETNFLPNAKTIKLYPFEGRGAGGECLFLELAHNTMAAHISEFPVGTYKKAHRHGPGAHVIILTGKGYSLLWPEGEEPRRVDWQPGSVVVPPNRWFHQHFNTGGEPARYLALRWNSQRYSMGGAITSSDGGGTDVDVKQGGWQIEYRDEDPRIHQIFEEEILRSGALCRMRSLAPRCTGGG